MATSLPAQLLPHIYQDTVSAGWWAVHEWMTPCGPALAFLRWLTLIVRISRECDEIHAFGRVAERTGVRVELRALRARQRTCMVDLVRKYKIHGDGYFYLPVGRWPEDAAQVELDNVKWVGLTRAAETPRPKRSRRSAADDE